MFKYKIFIIFHNNIDLSYYDKSILNKIIFVNVNPNNKSIYEDLNVINLHDLTNFEVLGKWYAETEVIYNIYKNKYLVDGLDFVGFAHYDIDLKPLTNEFIEKCLKKVDHINLQPYTLKQDYKQKILMDPEKPNQLTGEGKNCFVTIFDDFNNYYHTTHHIGSYMKGAVINLCASFIIKVDIFNEMMVFISYIIKTGKLDDYDTLHRHRIQGGLLERYFAIWFLLKNITGENVYLTHEFVGTNSQKGILSRVKGLLKVYIN